MRTLLHLSDLHFGKIDELILAPLIEAANEIRPDLAVVSGDLTQRAKAWQFRAAREFLDAVPQPQLVVPGNHDVPMHNPWARFMYPLDGYRRHFAAETEPVYQDDELAVLGLNSSRSLTIQDGRLNQRQIERLSSFFNSAPQHVTKILVSHHPFTLPPGAHAGRIVGGAPQVLSALARCRADMVLTGHLHTTHVSCTELQMAESGWSLLLSQAGTSTSTRLRGQPPAFNVLRIRPGEIDFQPYHWRPLERSFGPGPVTAFVREKCGWKAQL